MPFEYTRLDNIIDVVFSTTKDVEAGSEELSENAEAEFENSTNATYEQEHTPRPILESIRQTALEALEKECGVKLIAHKRAQYWSGDKSIRAVCPVSKLYPTGYFWYGLHPYQLKFLRDANAGFVLLGCANHPYTYAVPLKLIEEISPYLNTTEKPDRMYWHIHLAPSDTGDYVLLLPKKMERLSLTKYRLPLLG